MAGSSHADDPASFRRTRAVLGRSAERIVFAMHIALAAFVALRGYAATQDGPAHLYAAHVLWSLAHDPRTPFAAYFADNLHPAGNSLFFYVARPWGSALALESLAGITEFVALVGLPIGVWAFTKALRAQAPEASRDVLVPSAGPAIACVLAYNYFVYRGFFNFVLSVPLAFGTLAAVLAIGKPGIRPAAWLGWGALAAGLSALATLAHPAAAVFLLAAIPLTALRGPVRSRAAAAALTILLGLFAMGSHVSDGHHSSFHLENPLQSLMRLARSLGITHSLAEAVPVAIILGLLGWGAVRVWSSPRSTWRRWQVAWPGALGFALLVAYFVTPFEFGGAAGLNERIPLFIAALLLPFVPWTNFLRRVAPPAFLVFAIYTVVASVRRDARIHQILDSSGPDAIPRGSVVYPISLQIKEGSLSADLGRHLLSDVARRRDLVIGKVFCGHPAHPLRCLPGLEQMADEAPVEQWEHMSDVERGAALRDPASPVRTMFDEIASQARCADYLLVLGSPTLDPALMRYVIEPLGAHAIGDVHGAVHAYALPSAKPVDGIAAK